MPAGIDDLVVSVGRDAELRKQRARRQVARVARRSRMRDALALQVGHRLDRAVGLDDDDQVVGLIALFVAFDRERDRAGQVDRERGRPCRKAADVQATRAHRLDLGCIALYLEEDNALVGALS